MAHCKNIITTLLICLAIAQISDAQPTGDLHIIAKQHYVAGRWQLAAEGFQDFIRQHPIDPRIADARFYLAEATVQLRQYDRAIAAYSSFLQQHPDHRHRPRALFRQGEAALLASNRDKAAEILSRFNQKYPDHRLNQFALPYLGEIAFAADDHAAARRHYEKSLHQFPRGSLADEAHLHLAVINYEESKWAAAISHLHGFESRFPNSSLIAEAKHWRGISQFKAGMIPEAIATLLSTADQFPDQPIAAASTYFAGVAFRKRSARGRAKRQFDLVLESWPDSRWADDAIVSLMHLHRDDHVQTGVLLDRLNADFPKSDRKSEASRIHARALLQRQRYIEAVDVLLPLSEQTAEVQTDRQQRHHQTHRFLLAAAYLGQKQFQRALTTYQSVNMDLLDESLRRSTMIGIAESQIGLERYADALAQLDKIKETFPSNVDEARCAADRVIALTRSNQIQQANESYIQFVDKHPQHASRWLVTGELAEAAYKNGDRELARDLYSSLVEHGKQGAAQGISGLAWCYLEDGQFQQAIDTFDQMIASYPKHPDLPSALLAKAEAQEQLSNRDDAIATYRRLIEQNPDSKQAADALIAAARLLQQADKVAESLPLLSRFVQRYPNHSQRDGGLYLMAWALNDTEKKAESLAAFQQIHQHYTGSRYWADATYRLADHAFNVREFSRTTELLQAISESGENSMTPYVLFLTARVSIAEKRWAEVIAPLEKLVASHPGSELAIPAEFWIAEATYRLGDYVSAEESFRELESKTAGRSDKWMAMIPLRLSQILARQKQWPESAVFADRVRDNFPEFPHRYEADYIRGRCHAANAEFTKARACYQDVVTSATGAKTETAAMAQWMIGESQFHQRDYWAAIEAYLRVEVLYDFPRWQAAGLMQAGRCFEQLGQYNDAMKQYRQIKLNYPHTDYCDEAVARLQAVSESATKTALSPAR